MKRFYVVLGFIISLFALCVNFSIASQNQDVSNFIKYSPSMKDIVSGKEINLKDYLNKVMVLEFFETWCPACVKAIPELNKFYSNIQSDQKLKDNVVFYSILSSSSGDEKSIKDFIKSRGIKYPVLFETKPQLSYNLGVKFIPTLFIIKEGKVVYSKVGSEKADVLTKNLLNFVK
ncbi:MAG: TlpA disulfide reductase family protein [Candidatus Calescibacterium sp.]|nr:TlpA family protein disulfide reductase [Candidatus Calescibacterium sp.]MDW8132868.1 TlpA disulfide reductase family protein [Candidatus Calescibacterium sp.]